MKERIKVLLIDDEHSIRKLAEKEFSKEKISVKTVGLGVEAINIIKKEDFDVILLDIKLPDYNGIDLLPKLKEFLPNVEVIIITGYATIENAIQAMKLGAYDFILKPFQLDYIELLIEKAFERVKLKKLTNLIYMQIQEKIKPILVGSSKAINEVKELIKKASQWDVPVLITGETGTGKEVVASLIHNLSNRNQKPLVVKNCGEFQKDLMRAELFGYIKGAFTGANETKEGLIEMAKGGTLFLDEVGELTDDVQSALLRFLENKTYRRLGESNERHADVRLIFATHRNLKELVLSGKFSEALYYRINVFNIHMPPLRERVEDIPLLIQHFISKFCGNKKFYITDEAINCLMSYNWPGNVRELRNVIERAIILSENNVIDRDNLPSEISNINKKFPICSNSFRISEMEKKLIEEALLQFKNNLTKVARELGISRKTLYRKIKHYSIKM